LAIFASLLSDSNHDIFYHIINTDPKVQDFYSNFFFLYNGKIVDLIYEYDPSFDSTTLEKPAAIHLSFRNDLLGDPYSTKLPLTWTRVPRMEPSF